MIEIKITVSDMDYEGIAELALPVVKEKLAESDHIVGSFIGKYIPEATLNLGLKQLLNTLNEDQKDEVALSLIHKYEERIKEILQQEVSKKGVDMVIRGIEASQVNDSF